MEEERIVNLGGTINKLPLPEVSGNIGNQVPGKLPSADEAFSELAKQNQFGGTENIPVSSFYSGGERYSETRPFTDFEEMAGQQQSAFDQWRNGFGKFAGIAATTFVQGTAGLVYGIGSAITNQKFSNLYDNPVTRSMDDLQKRMEDFAPNYYTKSETDADWWSPDNFWTPNFWADKVIKNIGFGVGSLGGGLLWAKAFSMIGKANALIRSGKGAEVAANIEKAMQVVPKMQKASAIQNVLTNMSQGVRQGIMNNGDRILTSAMGTFGEASIEALQKMNEFRSGLIEEYRRQNGFDPTGEDLDEINAFAEKAGNYTWGMNTLLLTATNYIQLPKIIGSSKKAEKAFINDITQEGLGGKFVENLPKGKFKRYSADVFRAVTRTVAPSESLEEGLQFAIATGVDDFFNRAYENREELGTFLQTLGGAMGNIFGEGIEKTLTTKEGMESVIIGALSGGIQQAPMRIYTEGITGRGGVKAKNTAIALEELNKKNIEASLKDQANFISVGIGSQALRQKAIENNDILSEKDYEFDYSMSYLMPRAKYGKMESVYSELDNYKQQSLTPQGFEDLKSAGIALEKETQSQFTQRITNLENTAKAVEKHYDNINDTYSGVLLTDNEGNPVLDANKKPIRKYSPVVIDKLVYAASKIDDYSLRIPQLNNSLVQVGVNTSSILNDILVSEKPKTESLKEAMDLIDGMEVTSDIKDDLKRSLSDLVEMSMRRKAFIQEYDSIKKNPKAYETFTPIVSESAPVSEEAGNKVRVTTKDGEKDYEIGVEYYLGNVIEYDEKGREVFRFPKLTILGKNEDGTLRIRDNKGERDIDPEKLKDYKLGRVSTVANNPIAAFYLENINKIVKWNTGKEKGGVISGRLTYDSENNQLMFTYATRSKKGKRYIKSVPITTNSTDPLAAFRPKKGYTRGVFYFDGELTAVSKEKIEAAKNQTKKVEKLYDLNTQQARQELIADYQKELVEKQADISEQIRQKKADILTIEEDLAKLNATIEKGGDDARAKKGTRLKSAVRKALEASMRLSRAKEELVEELKDLETQQQEGELILLYLEDSVQSLSDLDGSAKAVIDQLEYEIELINESIQEGGKQISAISKLIDNIESAIDTAIDFLKSLVDQFEINYPKVPRLMGLEFNEFLKSNPNFLKIKPDYISDLRKLETFIAEVEDMEISPNQEKLQKLRQEVENLKQLFQSDINELLFKEALLAKLKKAYKDYQASGIEEERLMKNEALKKQILGTADNDNPVAPVYEKEFEVDSKKTVEIIPRATLGIDRGKSHQKRAQKFGLNFESFDKEKKRNIKGVYITLNNQDQLIPGLMDHLRTDENGVNETVDPKKIIAMVMVDVSSGEPVLVGQDGEVLTEEQLQDPLNNAIYQVFPLENLEWSGEYGEKSMFPEKTPKDVIDAVKEQYADWRKRILKIDDLSEIHSIDISFGFPQIKTDSEGKKLYDTRTSVQDAGLVSEYNIENNPLILVATSDETIVRGISVTKSAPGRVFLDMGNGLVPLQNRKHTKKEAEVIYKAILQFSKNVFDKTKGVNDDQSVALLKFLRSVVYWGIPQNEAGEKASGYSSVFFKDGKLFMSGKGQSFPFTPSGLEQNKDLIISVLSEMYHNVNGKMAKDIGMEYEQIINISEDGTIESVTWPNYQAYLLSKTTPDNKSRSGESLPLSTYVRPLEGTDDVNRSGIYFYTTDTEEDFIIPEVKKSSVITPIAKKEKSPQKFKLDNKTVNTAVSPTSGREFKFKAPENPSAEDITIIETPDALSAYKIFEEQGKDPITSLQEAILTIIKYNETLSSETEEVSSDDKAQKGREKLFGKSKVEKEDVEEVDESEKVEKGRAKLFGQKSTENIKEKARSRAQEILKRNPPSGGSNTEFRLAVEKQAKGITIENWEEIEAAWKQMLPGVPLYRLKNIIQATNGRQAWGMLKNGAIYVYENAEVGTFYHEVFEAIWKMFTNPTEQQAIINEFKSRKGTFIDRPTGKSVNYSEATPQQIKEQLAEEFRDYRLFKKLPAKPERGGSWISKLFADIVGFIKKFFTGKDAQSNTEKLFEKIGNGYYAKYTSPAMGVLQNVPSQIIEQEEEFATEEDELREVIPYKQRHEFIQQMAYTTLSMLSATDESLFNIANKTKAEIEEALLDNIYTVIDRKQYANAKNLEDGKISEEEFDALDEFFNDMLLYVDNNWKYLFSKYEEYMAQYQIEFDENDELQLRDEDKVKESDNVDALKIDAFRKANSAIKLLLATLPKTVRENGKDNAVPTSVGDVELLPLSQTFITVMNKLHMSRDVNDMMEKLRQLALEDGNYSRLYSRLAKKGAKEGNFEFKKLTTPHSIQLISSFWTTFKKMNPDVKNVFILDNGDVVIGDANLSKAAAQIATDYENGIILSAREGNGYFQYNADQKAYVAKDKIDDLKFNSSNIKENDNAMLKFLANIGVEFTKEDFNKLSKEDKISFRNVVQGIKKSFSQNKTLMTISKKTVSVQGRLTELALLKIKSSNPEIESTYFNLSGERTQSFIGINPLSDLRDFIDSVKNLNDNSVRESQYRYLVTDVFSKGSVILNKLYKKGGNKISDDHPDIDLLTVGYVGGTDNSTNGKRKPSSKLTYPERLSQEINLNLEGWYLNLVPGDASIEWMIKMGNHVSSTNMSTGYKKVMEIFKEYFKAEYDLAKSPDRTVDPSREKERQNLRFFYDILGKDLNDKIIQSKAVDSEAVYKEFEKQIEAAIKNYVEQKTKNFRNTLNNYGILQYDGTSFSLNNIKESSEGSMYSISKNMNEQTMMNNLTALTVNYMIANIELHKLIYSDPYQYADELKRIKSFSSPRQAIMSDPDNLTSGYGINSALNDVWNTGFEKGDLGYTDFNRNYFRTVTHTDVIGVVDVPGQNYEDYKETDGSGIMTLRTNRNIGLRSGNWTDDNERQYRHDIAYENLFRSGATKEELDQFDKENNPGIQSTYTPKKPIVAGNIDNGQNYNDVVLDKFALYPMSFRILHKINPSSNAIKLYEKMQKEDIDYIVFNSGRKVGARNSHTTYNKDGSFNSTEYVASGKGRNVINVPYKIFSIQAEVPSKDKAEVSRGSQVTKLLTMDFMASGVPVDYMSTEPNFAIRYKAWANEKDKENASKLYKEIKRNETLLVEMTKWGYNSLLKRFGIVESTVKGKKTYQIKDFSVAATTLRQEMLKREVNDNVSESLESFLKGNVILEATPAYQQVRNILYSIVDKEVVSPKITGGMKVQIPSTFLLDSNNIKVDTINGKTGFVSESLKFYEKSGERVAEIMIGRWFDTSLSDDELLDYLNNTEEGQKILKGIAFRIPTQNQNSIDAIKIAKFLPKEFGDSVVIPSALVAKVGSDFDIDKLSIYLKNVYKDAKDNVKLVPFYGYGQEAIEKFKTLTRETFKEKITIVEEKISKQSNLMQIFGDIALGIASDKLSEKWIPRFKEWFANDLVNDQLPVQLIEDVFMRRIESLNKKIEELTTKDLDEIFIQENAERLYKASLQNEYIQSSENLIKSDENYDKLMTPNSADQMKGLAKFIAEKTVGQSYDYKNVGNMLDRNFMSSLRHAFVTGKYAIGIAAVNQTNHSLMQRFMSFVDPARLRNVSDIDKKWLGDAKVKFQQFNQFEGKATLSMIKNPTGQFISDIIGQLIDGYVDISKGPWIMELGATPNVASTWLFLVKIGVPIDTVAYFMNQPIVRDYLQTIENAGYSWLFIDNFVDSSKSKFKSSISETRNQIPNTQSLKSMIGKSASQLSENEKADQQFILDEFLKYAKMAEHMFLVTQGTNYDTSNFNDPNLLYKKQEQFKKAQLTIISSVEQILENSFIGPLRESMSDSRDAMAEMLISERGKVRRVIQKVLQPYTDLSDREFVKVAQRVVSDLFDYAVQTNTLFRNKVFQTMINKGGYAYEIVQMVKEIKSNPNHPLYDNHVINLITPQLSPEASPGAANNIKIKGATNKIYDQNSIIYGFEEIKDYFESIGELYKYNKFKTLALFQSGLSVNRLAFTSLLPYEDFENIYNATIQKLESVPNLETFAELNVFERNNWGNDDIVPYEKAKWINQKDGTKKYNPAMEYLPPKVKKAVGDDKIPPVISMSTLGRKSSSDFFVYSWEDNISKEKKAEMGKKGDFSYIKRGLFRKVKDLQTGEPFVYTSNEKQYYIYQAVNAWGARERAQEFYDSEKPSVIDNGFIKVTNSVADEVIIGLFTGGKGITATQTQVSKEGSVKDKITNKNKPGDLPAIDRTPKSCQ